MAKTFQVQRRGHEQEERSKRCSKLRMHRPGLKPGGQEASRAVTELPSSYRAASEGRAAL